MPITVEIDGVGRVELDDSFASMTPEQQDATIADIAASARPPAQRAAPQPPAASSPAPSPAPVVEYLTQPPPASGGEPQFSDEWLAAEEAAYQASLREQGYIDAEANAPRPNETTATQAGILGFGDGATFGFLDEAGAVADMIFGGPEGTENVWTSDEPLSEQYAQNVAYNRRKLDAAQDEHGGAFLAGNVAGGLVPIGGSIGTAARAKGALAKLRQGAKTGAAYGAIYGAGSDEGNAIERLDGAAIGAGLGAAGGAALGGAAHAGSAAISPLARKAFPKLARAQFAREQAANPHAITDAKVADDLDKLVRTMMVDGAKRKLSKGQRSTLVSRVDDLETSYLPREEVKALDLPPSVKARLNTAMAKRHLLSDSEVQALRDSSPAGEAVADGIEKARRLRAYVSEASGNRNAAGGVLAEAIGSAAGWKVAGPVGGALGGRIGRAAVRSDDRAAREALALADKAPQFAQLPEVQAAREAAGAGDDLSRLSADALDAPYNASKAAEAEAARLETEGRKVAIANARDNITPSGGWRGLIYERTGLRPAEQDAGALAALKDGAISSEQFNAYLDEPGKLMAGNAGNALIDRLGAYAERGKLKRDPKWSRPEMSVGARASRIAEISARLDEIDPADLKMTQGPNTRRSEWPEWSGMPPELVAESRALQAELAALRADETAGVRNPLAYSATANANQRRVTDALSAVRSRDDLADTDRETIATAIANIGNTSSREQAQSIATDALDRLGADQRDYARSILSPLVAQIRR